MVAYMVAWNSQWRTGRAAKYPRGGVGRLCLNASPVFRVGCVLYSIEEQGDILQLFLGVRQVLKDSNQLSPSAPHLTKTPFINPSTAWCLLKMPNGTTMYTAGKQSNNLDFFTHFRALNEAACNQKGGRCTIYIVICVLAAMFLLTVLGFFVGVGIYSCRWTSRAKKRVALFE
jgi:hypothetical protein